MIRKSIKNNDKGLGAQIIQYNIIQNKDMNLIPFELWRKDYELNKDFCISLFIFLLLHDILLFNKINI